MRAGVSLVLRAPHRASALWRLLRSLSPLTGKQLFSRPLSCSTPNHQTITSPKWLIMVWRWGRESNPRCPYGHTCFPSKRTRPLCDLTSINFQITRNNPPPNHIWNRDKIKYLCSLNQMNFDKTFDCFDNFLLELGWAGRNPDSEFVEIVRIYF